MGAELDELLESKQKGYMNLGKKSVAEEKKKKEEEEESDTDSEAELATGIRTKKVSSRLLYLPIYEQLSRVVLSQIETEAFHQRRALLRPRIGRRGREMGER